MILTIVAGLALGVIATLTGIVRPIVRDGEPVEHQGADAAYATELHALGGGQHAAPCWWDLVTPVPDIPEAHPDPDRPQAALVRPYAARHQDDTVDLSPVTGAARIRAQYTDTELMPAVQA